MISWPAAVAMSVPSLAAGTVAATSTGFDWSSLISTAITPAIVVGLILFGKLAPEGVVKTYQQRAEAAEADNKALNKQLVDDVIPALTLATNALKEITPFLQAEIAIRTARNNQGGG